MPAERWRAPFALFPTENSPPPDAPGHGTVLPSTPARNAELALLAAPFRERVDWMLTALRGAGREPVVWETYRTPQRCKLLRRKGASKNGLKSLHRWGAAVDVICGKHRWACPKYGCGFFDALALAAKAQGLYWGGDLFPRNRITGRRFVDRPHVQAVPYREQNALRAVGKPGKYTTILAVEEYLNGRQ